MALPLILPSAQIQSLYLKFKIPHTKEISEHLEYMFMTRISNWLPKHIKIYHIQRKQESFNHWSYIQIATKLKALEISRLNFHLIIIWGLILLLWYNWLMNLIYLVLRFLILIHNSCKIHWIFLAIRAKIIQATLF